MYSWVVFWGSFQSRVRMGTVAVIRKLEVFPMIGWQITMLFCSGWQNSILKLNNSDEQKFIDTLFSYFGKLKSEITNLVCQRSLWDQEGIPVPFLSQVLVVFQSSCFVRQLRICPAFPEHILTAYVMSLLHIFHFFIIRFTGCLHYVLIFIWHKITFTATGESKFHSIFCSWGTNNSL